jgi:hypothetical protein
MISKHPIVPQRLRIISGSFACIEHRFLRDGFWAVLTQHELLLYFFLLLAADRQGLSYYGYDRICTLLQISLDEYILARDGLITKDLIAFDGRLFQVLSLPDVACRQPPRLLGNRQDMIRHDPATIHQLITTSLGGDHHD